MALSVRFARPVSDLQRSASMYVEALGFQEIDRFEDHEGFDGIILSRPLENWHIEFTYCRQHPVRPTPTPEDLLVLYVPDEDEWLHMCERLLKVGFAEVDAFNPYWQMMGRTFSDPDGYRIVIQQAA